MTRIFEDWLIVNIDENSYGRSVKKNYYWLSKSQSSGFVSTIWTGGLTLMWGITWNGDSMYMSFDRTTKIEDFWIFMYILRKYLENEKIKSRD